MWLPTKAFDLFHISRESVDSMRTELALVKAERDSLQKQANVNQINFDWLRMQVNTLQLERTALIEKVYNIKLPAPEITRQPVVDPTFNPKDFSFDDLGDDFAKKHGLPSYDKQ